MNYKKIFDIERNRKKIVFYDDCLNCYKENKLLDGLCFDCWIKQKKAKELNNEE